jgi:hypothetical protein
MYIDIPTKDIMEQGLLDILKTLGKEYIDKKNKEGLSNIVSTLSPLLLELCCYVSDVDMLLQFPKVIRDNTEVLYSAAISGNIEICTYLANENYKMNKVAIIAARRGNYDLVKAMISKGADELELIGRTAVSNRHIDIVKIVLDAGCEDVTLMTMVARCNEYKEIESLLMNR